MHAEHRALLDRIEAIAGPRRGPGGTMENDSYGGSGHPYYFVSVPDRRRIVRDWVKAHRDCAPDAMLAVATSLIAGASHEEKTLGTMVVAGSPAARRAVTPERIEAWLGDLNGWAEVDSLCQNLFKADDMAADWPAWRALIERLRVSDDINRRRSALVLLTGPVHYSADRRFSDLAFETIESLKLERPILITKAVSWLLRCLADNHAAAVTAYLDAQAPSLPAIAVRETRTKLTTGVKTPKRRKTDA